jgi:hypothetical protein
MSGSGEKEEVPPKFDEEGNPVIIEKVSRWEPPMLQLWRNSREG